MAGALAEPGGTDVRLERFVGFPATLLDTPARDLWRMLRGPALFAVAGRADLAPLFVSVLLHGNEETGWRAVQTVLRRHRRGPLPRPLLLLVGNVEAARAGVRTLPHQLDYNRVWPGTAHHGTPLARLMREVVATVRRQRPFASIDLHNNSGRNPPYACINRLDEPFLHLARLFSRTVVHFEEPVGVQSAAMAAICPAITVECGRSGDAASEAHAVELIEAALALQRFPVQSVPDGDIDLLRTFAIVRIPAEASFSFDDRDADIRLRPDLDHLNFSELEPGTRFGTLGHGRRHQLAVAAVHGDTADYFDYAAGDIRLARRAVPAMLTVDRDAVRLDCLGYLMHRIRRDGSRVPDQQGPAEEGRPSAAVPALAQRETGRGGA